MVDKLDQSLDTIMTERRKTNRRNRPRRTPGATKPTATAPVGGIKKATKPAKQPEKGVPAKRPQVNESKINVSNLPFDVTEQQVQEYFSTVIGEIKKCYLSYGPNGKSRGIATITFSNPAAAAQAAKQLDGVKVDNRAMKVEVVLGAKEAPPAPPQKTLGERITQQKSAKAQPKPATAAKKTTGDKKTGRVQGRRRGGGRTAGRGKPKSAEELDAEMNDYWVAGTNGAAGGDTTMATNGGAVQPAGNGDAAMEDEIE